MKTSNFRFVWLSPGKTRGKINHEIHVYHNKFLWKHTTKDRNRHQKRISNPSLPPPAEHTRELFDFFSTFIFAELGRNRRTVLDIIRKVSSCIEPRFIKPVFVRPNYNFSIHPFSFKVFATTLLTTAPPYRIYVHICCIETFWMYYYSSHNVSIKNILHSKYIFSLYFKRLT